MAASTAHRPWSLAQVSRRQTEPMQMSVGQGSIGEKGGHASQRSSASSSERQ